MKPYLFDGNFDYDNVAGFFNFMCGITTPGVEVYLRSPGGEVELARIMADYINRRYQDLQISLTGFEDLSSSAFILFSLVKCPKRLLAGTSGTIHFISMETSVREVESSRDFKINRAAIEEANNELYDYVKKSKALTVSQLKDLKNYKDVVLDYTRLCKALGI